MRIKSFCSWCFRNTTHRLVEESLMFRDGFICLACKKETVRCRAPGCDHMARGSSSEKDQGVLAALYDWLPDNFCAEHSGVIPSFSHLSLRLNDITDYKKLESHRATNYKAWGQIAAYSVGGMAILGPAAYFAIPSIATSLGGAGMLGNAFTGKIISMLSGAALESASLAAIGSTGIATIMASGAGLGAVQGGLISAQYLQELKEFKIVKVKSGKGPGVVVVNGFLYGEDNHFDWLKVLKGLYPENPWYQVRWDSSDVDEVLGIAVKGVAYKGLEKVLTMGIPRLRPFVGPLGWFALPQTIAKNPWFIALANAQKAGAILADVMARTDGEYILLGHSLGCRVIGTALHGLAAKKEKKVISAFLLGGASDGDPKFWRAASFAVKKQILNFYSKHDMILRYAFKVGTAFQEDPIGFDPIGADSSKVVDMDCSSFVKGHFEWKDRITDLLKMMTEANGRRRQISCPVCSLSMTLKTPQRFDQKRHCDSCQTDFFWNPSLQIPIWDKERGCPEPTELACPYCLEAFLAQKPRRLTCGHCAKNLSVVKKKDRLLTSPSSYHCPFCSASLAFIEKGKTDHCAECGLFYENRAGIIESSKNPMEAWCKNCDDRFPVTASGAIDCPYCFEEWVVEIRDGQVFVERPIFNETR